MRGDGLGIGIGRSRTLDAGGVSGIYRRGRHGYSVPAAEGMSGAAEGS